MRALSAVAVLIALAWATEAHAYCLSTTCKDTDACEGEEVPGCSVLKWKSRCVGYSIHEAGGPGVNSEALDNIVMLAYDAWRLGRHARLGPLGHCTLTGRFGIPADVLCLDVFFFGTFDLYPLISRRRDHSHDGSEKSIFHLV